MKKSSLPCHQPTLFATLRNTIIQEDEPIIVHDEIQNDATVVLESYGLQKNEVVTQVVPQFDIQNDETTVQSFQQLNDDATSAISSQLDILNDDATQPPQHDVLNVASEDVTHAPLLNELNDEAAAVTQEPQQEILHDEATDTPQHDSVIFSDDDTTQPQQLNALNDDVTQAPQELQDDEATKRSQADEASSTEPALVEKAEVASQDEPVVTEVPVKVTPSQHNQDVVDIILDDVVIPSEPEILNQVRETADTHLHSEPKPVENIPSVDAYNNEPELYHGVRNADNDTVEIVNLSAAPIEQASVQTTQQPFELNNDLEEGETVQNDEVISQTQFLLNAEATTVQNLVALRVDNPEATTSFFIERVVEHDETSQGTTEGILHEEGGIYNDEVSVTTERELRSDIEILSDPHHEEGHEGHVHEETTVVPSNLERERSDLILNDEVQVTTERELRSDILSDPHHEEGHEGHVHEETTVAPSNLERERSDLILNDEVQVTTERELRSDILSDPHHEEGHVLEETTVVPSNLERERSDLILNDEEPATTSVPLYRNKVQKVAEALVDVESSAPESGENKFRLDVDVFKGSVEVSESPAEVTTGSPATDLLRSGLGSLEIVEDAPQTTLRSLEDVPALRDGLAELTTQSPSNLRADLDLIDLTTQSSSNLRADIDFDDVEVSTQKAVEALILNDDATESSPLQDEVVTTPSARMADVLYQEVVEGSGLTSSNLVQAAAEVTEGSGSAPILDDEPPAQTTSLPVIHDDSENELVETNKVSASEEPVTTSYAFRMDLLNSLEETDAKEPEILQKDAAAPTNSPQVAAAKDEVNELAVQDEQVTTEAVSRFRLDLEITTESPVAHSRDDVPEQSTVVSEILRAESDFVEVSTVSSSGFAAAFRDDLESDATAVTEAIVNDAIIDSSTVKPAELLRSENIEASTVRFADEKVEIANDEPATPQAAEASVTVPSTRKDNVDTIPVVFADEPEASTGNPSERLRTETVQVEQQTEAISVSLQDAPEINDDEASSAATTIASTTNFNENDSTPKIVNKVGKEGVTLPETGVPKIQPISPDISRSNPHELRFDFQLPPEDSSWLSRAVNQFRRLSGFGSDAADASSVKPKIPSRSFLLF